MKFTTSSLLITMSATLPILGVFAGPTGHILKRADAGETACRAAYGINVNGKYVPEPDGCHIQCWGKDGQNIIGIPSIADGETCTNNPAGKCQGGVCVTGDPDPGYTACKAYGINASGHYMKYPSPDGCYVQCYNSNDSGIIAVAALAEGARCLWDATKTCQGGKCV